MYLVNLCPNVIVSKNCILFPQKFLPEGIETSVEFHALPMFGFDESDFDVVDERVVLRAPFSFVENDGTMAFVKNEGSAPGIVLIYPFPYHRRRVKFLVSDISLTLLASYSTYTPDQGKSTAKVLCCEGYSGSKGAVFEYRTKLHSLWIQWDLESDYISIRPDFWII